MLRRISCVTRYFYNFTFPVNRMRSQIYPERIEQFHALFWLFRREKSISLKILWACCVLVYIMIVTVLSKIGVHIMLRIVVKIRLNYVIVFFAKSVTARAYFSVLLRAQCS